MINGSCCTPINDNTVDFMSNIIVFILGIIFRIKIEKHNLKVSIRPNDSNLPQTSAKKRDSREINGKTPELL